MWSLSSPPETRQRKKKNIYIYIYIYISNFKNNPVKRVKNNDHLLEDRHNMWIVN